MRKHFRASPVILELKGDNFEIGRGLGKFWGNYFCKLNKIKNDKRIKELHDKCKKLLDKNEYEEWLQKNHIEKKEYGKLLTNMVQQFPALFDELVGMNVGINESKIGFKASLFGLFTCWLSETDESFTAYNACSSVLLKIKDGFYLAHSDENNAVYPLVVAHVSLKTKDKDSHFISISHPFQLLGSAAGMNHNFAFQGNSIGCKKDIFDKLRDTWHERIPKTVFTRMMLEMSSMDEIKTLYEKNYASTLPNHHYVAFDDKAYSIEVRLSPKQKLIVCPLKGEKPHIHTNHFLDQRRDKNDKYEKESKGRWNRLKEKMEGIKSEEKDVRDKFLEFLHDRKNKLINRTSGSFFFKIQQRKPLSCKGELYFDNTPININTNRTSRHRIKSA